MSDLSILGLEFENNLAIFEITSLLQSQPRIGQKWVFNSYSECWCKVLFFPGPGLSPLDKVCR